MLSDENVQRYFKALYSIAVMLFLVPLADLSLRVFPPQFGTLQWRFSTIGLLLGNAGTILLGLGLFGLVAAVAGHRKWLRGLGFVALALGVVVLAVLVLFALDAIQMRRMVIANLKRPVLISSMGALFNGMMGAITLFVIGRAAIVASRVTRAVERRTKVPPPIVVSRPAATDPARASATESV